ncbi:MAG: phosphate signaling complex protein PhoU [Deltaproteobacteria bacterium]|nr:phosphate signaling complex protein PhoU [Deltaproteobacteria bacterium]
MPLRLKKEMNELLNQLYTIESMVEESVSLAVEAVLTRNTDLAQMVIENDRKIDLTEVELEEECLKVLALYQPVAGDLRLIVAILKMNNDLERIGDLASNIAEKAIFLAENEKTTIPYNFRKMSETAILMLKECFDALSETAPERAHKVRIMDDTLDTLNREMYSTVESSILKSVEKLDIYIHMMGISRNLERVGDLAVNIAEDIIYMCEGSIIRHSHKNQSR